MGHSMIGIVIENYSSIVEVIKILRKYTDDSISIIQNHIKNGEIVLSCSFFDHSAIKTIIIKCINELKKKKITVKIFEDDEEITMQMLKNWVGTSRDISIQTEAEVELEAEEFDMAELESFSYLWDGSEPGWIVLKDKYDYTIFNKETQMALLMEDEDLNNRLAAMMILSGCEVVTGKRKINKLLNSTDGD